MTGCSKEEEVVKEEVIRPAKMMTIEQSEASKTLKYPGNVRALDRVEISFEVSGKLVELAINEGQEINKGDLIARIDSSDFKNRLAVAMAKVNHAKTELGRYANLLDEKVVAKSTYDVKKRNYDVVVSDMKIARKALADTSLKAPFSGRIGKRFVENYQVVQAKQSIVSLQRLSDLEIIVNAPENVMANRTNKNKIEFSAKFPNYPGDTYPLTVKEFSTEADPQTQTYRVTLIMPNPEGKTILDGMTANVSIVIYQNGDNTFEVPVQAVFFDVKGQASVWKVGDDLRVKQHKVSVGKPEQNNIAILAGLSSGDKIITLGVQNLVEGQKVREFTGTMGE
ncbi:MAG: efflux RND transporter periplasmic adaptor subunit [Thermodesulfobacteriota bacterium]|nr:efflux RND transporter periplasmic adaptor subunit [Thermodesulfobacteriota bacterium]